MFDLYSYLADKYGCTRSVVKEVLFAFRYGSRDYTDEELEKIFVRLTGLEPVK